MMESTALEQPPRRKPPAPPRVRWPPRPRPRPSQGRALVVGLIISVLAHLAVLMVVQRLLSPGPGYEPAVAAADPDAVRPEGMRVYRIIESVAEVPPVEEQVPDRPEPTPPAPVAPPAEPEARPAPDPAAPDAPSAVERLRPQPMDPRLFGRLPPRIEPQSPEEVMRERIYGRIDALNDSMFAALEADRRGRDWTFTTEDGKRWGVSPEGIHLGDIVIPVPSLGASPARREEYERALRDWSEIQRQAGSAVHSDEFRDRVRAIRERRERERNESQESREPN